MKASWAGLLLLGFLGQTPAGVDEVRALVLERSSVSIVHSSHLAVNELLVRIDGKWRVVDRIRYLVDCRNGQVEARIVYELAEGRNVVQERRRTGEQYAGLWRDLIEAGFEDLAALPLDEPVDPFEFIDAWRIDELRYDLEFRIGRRKVSFPLYDIESYRDPRFLKIARMVEGFLEEDRRPK